MRFFIVDVFAEEKYQGNQLGVLIPDRELATAEMQKIARETNYSETTFIMSGKQDNGGYDVRIFTPDEEIPFAGHPTLGTAFIIHRIIEGNESDSGQVLLNYKVGTIPVTISAEGFSMRQNQPSFELLLKGEESATAEMLSIAADDIDGEYPLQIVSTGLPSLITPLKSVEAVKRCRINNGLMQHFFDNVAYVNILVFARDGDNIYTRVFMPDSGIGEDPATGSAAGNLAGYLLKYGYFGKNDIQYVARQGNEIGRSSLLRVKASLTDDRYEINVAGKVFLVAQGDWL